MTAPVLEIEATATELEPVLCPLKAGQCTPDNCVNLDDEAAQALCSLC